MRPEVLFLDKSPMLTINQLVKSISDDVPDKVTTVYTHFTYVPYAKYKNLKYVICPCTNIDHLRPNDHPDIVFIYLDDKTYLYKYVYSTAEWTIQHMYNLIRHNKDELYGSSIGFIGYGRIAQQVHKMLSGTNIDSFYVDFDDAKIYEDVSLSSKRASLEFIMSQCKIISVHLSNTNNTKDYIAQVDWDMMGDNRPYFLNSARAAVVEPKALLKNIQAKNLKGVALDVLEGYPEDIILELLKLQYLNKHNLFITPHIGGCSEVSRYYTDMYVIEKLKEVKKHAK